MYKYQCILQETIKIVGAKNYFSQENLTTFNKEKNTIFAGKRSRVWEKTALEVRDRCRHALLRARRASSAAPLCSRDRSQTSYFFKVCKNNEQRRIMPPFWGWASRLPRSMLILPIGVRARSGKKCRSATTSLALFQKVSRNGQRRPAAIK